MYKIIFVICSLACLVSQIKPQDIVPICDPIQPLPPVTPEIPLPVLSNTLSYQAVVERNKGDLRLTEEFIEYYDGVDNIGISGQFYGQSQLLTYSIYPTNELIVYYPGSKTCETYVLDDPNTPPFSPFTSVVVNGQNHILSPLNAILNGPGIKYSYNGTSEVRGIPVNQWVGCTYSKFESKYILITVSFTDPKKWNPASLDLSASGDFKSIPVEVKVLTQEDPSGKLTSVYYSVTQFKPFVKLELENYNTPSGVYCKNRKNIRELPDVPHSFQFQAQVLEPKDDGSTGTITNYFDEYSYKYQIFRISYIYNNQRIYEIHDYNTGLKYRYDEKSLNCEVKKISLLEDPEDSFTTGGNNIKLKDPAMFFSIDDRDSFQFTGYKRIDGVLNEVWIGPKNLSGVDALYEWHYLSRNWNLTSQQSEYQIPVFLRVYTKTPIRDSVLVDQKELFRMSFFNFKADQVPLNDFDLARCNNIFGKKYFQFNIQKDSAATELIRKNLYSFREAVAKTLHEKARVTYLRISRVIVIFREDSAHVLFTMFEKSSFYGDVKEPKHDEVSDKAAKYLKDSFSNDEVVFEFKISVNETTIVRPDTLSFRELDKDHLSPTNFENTVKRGTDGGTVAGVTILMTLVGIAIGSVVVYLEKRKTIQILKPFYN